MRLIIFDCDGTLVDSQHTINSAMTEAFEVHNLIPPDRFAILSVVGLSLPDAISLLAPDQQPLAINSLSQAYKTAYKRMRAEADHVEPLYDGVRQGLEHLAGQEDTLLGIATGKSRQGVRIVFEKQGFTDYFVTIQTADDAPSKPHPGMIERAMDETGVGAENTVMIGDTSFDMLMARNAGVSAIGVRWGYHPADKLLKAGANGIAEDFPMLLRLIDRFGSGRGMAE